MLLWNCLARNFYEIILRLISVYVLRPVLFVRSLTD